MLADVPRVLFVDDSEDDLELIRDLIAQHATDDRSFRLLTALSGQAALETLKRDGPLAIIISDMAMPGMTGAQLLARVTREAPETVRIMLTGLDDQASAAAAVNDGQVFRFLTKPLTRDRLLSTLQAALEQHRLIRAEKALLSETLTGAVTVLLELFARSSPIAYARAIRVRRIARELALELGAKVWEVELAAALSQIGFGPDAESALQKRLVGTPLTPREIAAYRSGPERTAGLLERVPRLESLAGIVRYQDAPAWPERVIGGTQQQPPFGARILKVALDFDELLLRHKFVDAAFEELRNRGALYDSSVTAALRIRLPQLTPASSGEAA